MLSGAGFVSAQRSRLISELQVARREGLRVVQQLLERADPAEIDLWWPLIAPILESLIVSQQRTGRGLMLAAVGAQGVAMGVGVVTATPTSSMVARDGVLPSGLSVARLVRSTPRAMAHRIENGLSVPEAWRVTSSHLVSAVADAAHDEARRVASDVLMQGGADWKALDNEYAARVADARERAVAAEQRRIRRNMSPRSRAALEQQWGPGWARRYTRVPSPNACPFCLMLATKGPVYYKDSFDAANQRFRGDGNARAHNHCQCVLIPEPAPGAYKGVAFGDPEAYEKALWTDPKSKRTYELRRITAQLSLLPSSPGRYVTAA